MYLLRQSCLVIAVLLLVPSLLAQRPARFSGVGMLLLNAEVAKELKLTDKQVTKVKEIAQQVRAKFKDDFAKVRGGTQEERRKNFQKLAKAFSEETYKSLQSVLTPAQHKRLKQLELQMRGVGAFAEKEIHDALKLTQEQKDKIQQLTEASRKQMRKIFQDAGGNFKDAIKQITTLRKETLAKVTGLLEEKQQATWKELSGEPFEFKLQSFRPSSQ